MIKEASKDDILQEKEFEKWCSKNYSQILHWFDKILDYERNLLIQEGKIEKIEIVKYKIFKILYKSAYELGIGVPVKATLSALTIIT